MDTPGVQPTTDDLRAEVERLDVAWRAMRNERDRVHGALLEIGKERDEARAEVKRLVDNLLRREGQLGESAELIEQLREDLAHEQNLARETLDELASRPLVPVNAVALRAELDEANQRIAYFEARVGYQWSLVYDTRADVTARTDERDAARAEVKRLKADLEKAYTLVGERALRDLGIAAPGDDRRPHWRDNEGDLWKELPDGLLSLVEYKGARWTYPSEAQDKAWIEAKYGPLVPAAPLGGA